MITLTKGDDPTLTLTATTDGSTAFNLTGATLTTYFLNEDGTETSVANGDHTITDAANGQYSVDLSSADLSNLKEGSELSFKTQVVISGQTTMVWFDDLLTVRPSEIKNQ